MIFNGDLYNIFTKLSTKSKNEFAISVENTQRIILVPCSPVNSDRKTKIKFPSIFRMLLATGVLMFFKQPFIIEPFTTFSAVEPVLTSVNRF